MKDEKELREMRAALQDRLQAVIEGFNRQVGRIEGQIALITHLLGEDSKEEGGD